MKLNNLGFGLVAALSVTAVVPGIAGAATTVDFEDNMMITGQSVEGLGTVHADLNIQSIDSNNPAVVIETTYRDTPDVNLIYAAPAWDANNCLEDENGERVDIRDGLGTAKGFSQESIANMSGPQEFDFSFGGKTATYFSIRMFDFGDWNPQKSVEHSVTLTGYDHYGKVVDEFELAFTNNGEPTPYPGQRFGDACRAELGDPGYVELSVEGTGIARVELRSPVGHDPRVGFDSIKFDICDDMDGDTVCDANDACPGTVIPEASSFNGLNPNHYALATDKTVFTTSAKGGKILVDSIYTIADTNGCSCEQILDTKPGDDIGEYEHGCTNGTMENWINMGGWAIPE